MAASYSLSMSAKMPWRRFAAVLVVALGYLLFAVTTPWREFEWLAAAATVLIFVSLQTLVLMVTTRLRLPAEYSRKVLHVCFGVLFTLSPLLYDSAYPLLALSALALVWFVAIRRSPALRWRYGATRAFGRPGSFGDLCFVPAFGILFLLARDEPAVFYAAALVLTFADAAAAVVGTRYGSARYAMIKGYKSLQGSAAFFLVTMVCLAVVLVPNADFSGDTALFVFTAALFLTIVEAVSWGGLDNVTVPMGCWLLLQGGTFSHTPRIHWILAAAGILATLIYFLNYRNRRAGRSSSTIHNNRQVSPAE